MGDVIKIGDTTARIIAEEREFDPVIGDRTVQTWEGDEEDLQAQATLFRQQGFRARVYQYGGPVYRMQVSLPDDGGGTGTPPQVDTWERITETAQEDIRNNPLLVAAVTATVPDNLKSAAMNAFYKDFKQKIRDGNNQVTFGEPALQAFFDLLSRGTDAHEVRRTVLRRRRSLPLTYLAQSEVLAVERIYSTAALVNAYQVPQAIASKLPVAGDITPSNTAWGWKERADTSTITGLKVEELKEFVFAAWSTALYQHIF